MRIRIPVLCRVSRSWAPILVFAASLLAAGCAGRLPSEPPMFSFAVFADVQYGDKDTAGARHYRDSADRLREAVAIIEDEDPDFAVNLGDIIDGYAKDPKRSAEELEPILDILRHLDVPLRHAVGNHCLTVGRDALLQALKLGRAYYEFTVPEAPGWRFIVLDGNDAGYGVVSESQMLWFRMTLKEAVARGERVVCFCHFPLLREAAPNHRIKDPAEILAALDANPCVAAWFAGHDHGGGYAYRNGVHHVTLKGMVETDGGTSFAIVEARPSGLLLKGFGRETTRLLPVGAEGREIGK